MSFGLLHRPLTGIHFSTRRKNTGSVLFEMCLDLAVWADAVICDYNYVFDPNVHLKRFFSEGAAGKYIFLIDEAHNLVERGGRCTVHPYVRRMCWK